MCHKAWEVFQRTCLCLVFERVWYYCRRIWDKCHKAGDMGQRAWTMDMCNIGLGKSVTVKEYQKTNEQCHLREFC